MRTKLVIFFLLAAIIFVMAGTATPPRRMAAAMGMPQRDTIPETDSLNKNVVDTTKMDSLELAIYRHNKAVGASMPLDFARLSESR